jgi:hypothetical protein
LRHVPLTDRSSGPGRSQSTARCLSLGYRVLQTAERAKILCHISDQGPIFKLLGGEYCVHWLTGSAGSGRRVLGFETGVLSVELLAAAHLGKEPAVVGAQTATQTGGWPEQLDKKYFGTGQNGIVPIVVDQKDDILKSASRRGCAWPVKSARKWYAGAVWSLE